MSKELHENLRILIDEHERNHDYAISTESVKVLIENSVTQNKDTTSNRFEIESVDRYWYWSSRNGRSFCEITFWYNPYTLERKETSRRLDNYYDDDDYRLPDWAKSITIHRKKLDYN